MMWRRLSILIGLLLLAIALCAAQDPTANPQFFAGVVSRIDAKHISVSRTLVGHSPETHAFMIDSATRMPKPGLKPRMRVTVRYEHKPEGDLALEIQIRPADRVVKGL